MPVCQSTCGQTQKQSGKKSCQGDQSHVGSRSCFLENVHTESETGQAAAYGGNQFSGEEKKESGKAAAGSIRGRGYSGHGNQTLFLLNTFDRQSAHWCDRPGRCTEEENRKDVLSRPTVSLLNGEKQGGLSPPLLRFRTGRWESWFPSDCLPASAEAVPGCR